MKKIFGDLKMNWLTVIVFAIITGVYTGFVMSIPAFENTSIQDIGVTYEWWVIFAVIVVVNCKKSYEAAFKCFVFFLISQPLVFVTEVLMKHITSDLALYYYFGIWFKATLFTLPGGLIAYYCKKQNLIGTIILGIGNAIQVIMGVYYANSAITDFPHHILTVIICFVSVFVMSFSIQKDRKNQIISILLPFVLLGVTLVLLSMTGRTLF
jgi:hypothetical protein